MKTQLIIISCLLSFTACQSIQHFTYPKELKKIQERINWNCINIEIHSDDYENTVGSHMDSPIFFDLTFSFVDTLQDTSKVNIEFLFMDYSIGGGINSTYVFWTSYDKGYLVDLKCSNRNYRYPEYRNMEYTQLTKEETIQFVKLYNEFLPKEEAYVYQKLNCSNCVFDGGGDVLLFRKNNENIYYYENENCDHLNVEKTLFGEARHDLIVNIKQIFNKTWEKYYPEGIKCN